MSSFYDNYFEEMRNIEKSKQDKEEMFRRLCAEPCMKVPKPGDRVIIAAGLLGRGFLWVRTEAEVLQVADTSVKVRFKSSFSQTPDVEEWIHPALITDVLSKD